MMNIVDISGGQCRWGKADIGQILVMQAGLSVARAFPAQLRGGFSLDFALDNALKQNVEADLPFYGMRNSSRAKQDIENG